MIYRRRSRKISSYLTPPAGVFCALLAVWPLHPSRALPPAASIAAPVPAAATATATATATAAVADPADALQYALWYRLESDLAPELDPAFPADDYRPADKSPRAAAAPRLSLPAVVYDNADFPATAAFSAESGTVYAAYRSYGQPNDYRLRETLYDGAGLCLAVLEYRYIDMRLRSLDRLDGADLVNLARIDRDYAGRVTGLEIGGERREFAYDADGRLLIFDSTSPDGLGRGWRWRWDERGLLLWEYRLEVGAIVDAERYDYDDGGRLLSIQRYTAQNSLLIPQLATKDEKE